MAKACASWRSTTRKLMRPPSQSRKHLHEKSSGPEVATLVLPPSAQLQS